MKRIGEFVLVMTWLLTQPLSGSCFQDPLTHPSKSIQDAKRKGTFAAQIQIVPNEFSWRGHKFKVHEAWFEMPRKKPKYHDYIGFCFTFEVDGKYPSEAAGDLMFRENSGIFWYGKPPFYSSAKIPIHCIDAQSDEKEIERHVVDRLAPGFSIKDPPGPDEVKLKFSRVDSSKKS